MKWITGRAVKLNLLFIHEVIAFYAGRITYMLHADKHTMLCVSHDIYIYIFAYIMNE